MLAEIAQTVHELFPHCLRCGAAIAHPDDADVRLFRNRLVHRGPCPSERAIVEAPAVSALIEARA